MFPTYPANMQNVLYYYFLMDVFYE